MEKQQSINTALDNSYSYEEYITLIKDLHEKGMATSFQDNPAFLDYSTLSLRRMERIFKKVKLNEDLVQKIEGTSENQTWMLITESWCGDASQTVPIIAKLATLNSKIDLRIVLRDSNEDVMEHYLTNGGKSIPILAVLNEDKQELKRWGPRPVPAQAKVIEYKNLPEPKPAYSELSAEIQGWYNKDKAVTTQEELLSIL